MVIQEDIVCCSDVPDPPEMSATSFCSSSPWADSFLLTCEYAPCDSLPLTPPLYTGTPVSSLNSSYHLCLWVSLSSEMWWPDCPHHQYPFLLCIPPLEKGLFLFQWQAVFHITSVKFPTGFSSTTAPSDYWAHSYLHTLLYPSIDSTTYCYHLLHYTQSNLPWLITNSTLNLHLDRRHPTHQIDEHVIMLIGFSSR